MVRHVVCRVEELPPGTRRIVEVAGRSIGVFNVNGTYCAIKNVCPHQMAPLCLGRVGGTTLPSPVGEFVYGREGEIIRCPWHGWEFDLLTGRSVFNPHRVRVKTYEVTVEPQNSPMSTPHAASADQDDDVHVETYRVAVEHQYVVLYV